MPCPAIGWTGMLPVALRPYARLMRLERPIGWWLLLLPCWWGLALGQMAAGGGLPNLWYAALFLIGAVIMRGAGCTLNDIADRNFDAQVARTRLAAHPGGPGQRQAAAVIFLDRRCASPGSLVLLQFNWFTVFTGAASLLIVAVYPFMKRITYWPQAVLGLAFNWGALVGWTAIAGLARRCRPSCSMPAASPGRSPMTRSTRTRTRRTTLLIGVKSTALKFGDASLAGSASSSPWRSSSSMPRSGWPAAASSPMSASPGRPSTRPGSLRGFDADNPARCLELFRSNRIFGLIITASLFLDCIIT